MYAVAGSGEYSVSFNDINDGSTNAALGGGFPAVTGYDLSTGLGSPQCGLIYELVGGPTPPPPPPGSGDVIINAQTTQIGPTLCVDGSGFPAGAAVQVEYTGIPGVIGTQLGNTSLVASDGSFNSGPELANAVYENCSPTDLGNTVTVTVKTTNGPTFQSTATMPASFWCTNGGSESLGVGCVCNNTPECAP